MNLMFEHRKVTEVTGMFKKENVLKLINDVREMIVCVVVSSSSFPHIETSTQNNLDVARCDNY